MTILVYYKYAEDQSYFREDYYNKTPDQVQQIETRYSDAMKNGEYVSLVIIIEK